MSTMVDPSREYVLAEDSPYLANMAALWACDPALAGEIEATEGKISYPVETTKSGQITLAMALGDGRKLYLHSRYQPAEEAVKLVESSQVDQKLLVCVHGFGLGYHIEEVFNRVCEEAFVVVFEPDLVLLRTAFEQRDLSRLIESRRIILFAGQSKVRLLDRLAPFGHLICAGFGSLDHPVSLQVAGDYHNQVKSWMADYLSLCRTNLATAIINGRRTSENLARNLKWYAGAPGLSRLAGRYQGYPAIIVSAGPSLRKNKHLLKNLDNRAVLIAVQTTLQPMVEMGIEPHFATTLDYHDICTRFFEKLPRTCRTELVAEPKASSAIFSLHPGPVTLLGNEFADHLLAEMKIGKPRLRSGATVAHLAYFLAEYMKCDPIIFIGQDLGFSDGLCYTPGTSYEDVWRPELSRFCTVEMKQWEQIVRERHILRKVPDWQGRPMYTEERLYAYLQQFEKEFAVSQAKIIDATEGGVGKRGTLAMTLAQAMDRFCTRPIPVFDDHPGYQWKLISAVADSLRIRRSQAKQVLENNLETLPLLEEIRDHINEQTRVNRLIARIDALRSRMRELEECYSLVMQLTQASEMRRFQLDSRIAASRATGMEKQKLQLERDIENVKSVRDATVEFMKLMDEVIAGLDGHKATGGRER